MWDDFENLTKVLAKLRVLLSIHTFLEILPAYSLKPPNLFNFREGHQKGRGRQQGGAFFGRGAPTGNVIDSRCQSFTAQWCISPISLREALLDARRDTVTHRATSNVTPLDIMGPISNVMGAMHNGSDQN